MKHVIEINIGGVMYRAFRPKDQAQAVAELFGNMDTFSQQRCREHLEAIRLRQTNEPWPALEVREPLDLELKGI